MSLEHPDERSREQWARDLLAEAGDTITVTPAAPPVAPPPRSWIYPAVVAAVVAGLVAGSALWWNSIHGSGPMFGPITGPASPPSVTPSPSPTETATTAPALRTVPNVLGLVEDEAVARISEVGYRVETTYEGDGVECDRQLVIVLQDPPSGNTVEEGSTVHLTSWCVGDRVAQSISVASRFATAAHTGRLGMLSIDTPVRLYLGGQYITDLQPEKATTWKAWNVCGAESYAGRVCPFNPLQLIKGARDIDGVDQPERITTATPSHSCAHWPGTPAELEAYRTISLEVGEGCTSWGAVTLYLNDVGQIVAVDQILAEP